MRYYTHFTISSVCGVRFSVSISCPQLIDSTNKIGMKENAKKD